MNISDIPLQECQLLTVCVCVCMCIHGVDLFKLILLRWLSSAEWLSSLQFIHIECDVQEGTVLCVTGTGKHHSIKDEDKG